MARANLQIKTGTYTGTGSALAITDVGFEPQVVIVKGGSNHAVFRVKQNRGDSTCYLATNTANLTGGITGFTNSGFNVGTDATVNANGTGYFYFAMSGADAQQNFRTFYYRGTGADNRNITTTGINFTPDFVHVKQDGANVAPSYIIDQTGDNSLHLLGSAVAANEIQGVTSNGFQVGTSTRANGLDTDYYGFALKKLSKIVTTGTFTGTGAAQTIDIGFKPDWVILENVNAATAALIKTSDMATTTSHVVNNFASVTTGITSFVTNGFTVGTLAAANGSTNTLYYIAGRTGTFNGTVTRTAS
jgi:hypothetical protein